MNNKEYVDMVFPVEGNGQLAMWEQANPKNMVVTFRGEK